MKLKCRCISCQVEVRFRDVVKLFSNEELRYRYMTEILRLLHDYARENTEPAPIIATRIFRYLKEESNNPDPYREEKHRANIEGLKILEKVEELLEAEECKDTERILELSVKLSLLGNSLDLGVANYRPPPMEELLEEVRVMSINGTFPMIENKEILYLLDNAGEAALDRILARTLRQLDNKIIAVVKGGSFQNDVTINEVAELGLDQDFDEVITTGTDAASIFLNEVDREFIETLEKCDIIIAKGMAHFEYITEIENVLNKPIIYMFKAKCEPIAEEAGVVKGSYVILRRGI